MLYKIKSYLTCCYAFLEILNQNLNLKFYQMDFFDLNSLTFMWMKKKKLAMALNDKT
jgi:hypothetical protein